MSPCETENESVGMINWLTKVFIATAALAAIALLADSGRASAAETGADAKSVGYADCQAFAEERDAGVLAPNFLRSGALERRRHSIVSNYAMQMPKPAEQFRRFG